MPRSITSPDDHDGKLEQNVQAQERPEPAEPAPRARIAAGGASSALAPVTKPPRAAIESTVKTSARRTSAKPRRSAAAILIE
jgi:hypothetical protein